MEEYDEFGEMDDDDFLEEIEVSATQGVTVAQALTTTEDRIYWAALTASFSGFNPIALSVLEEGDPLLDEIAQVIEEGKEWQGELFARSILGPVVLPLEFVAYTGRCVEVSFKLGLKFAATFNEE